jgi:formylglycine-generating enzyme required for sulfatase activity
MRRALAIAALPKVWRWAMCVALCPWSLPALAVDLEALNHGVVKIESVHPEKGPRTGTGFIVRRDRDVVYIVTAHHVVEGDKVPKVTFYASQVNPVSAEVARNDIASDLSLLLVRGPDKVPESARALGLSLGDTGLAGRQGVTIGFPAGLDGGWIPSDVRIARRDGSRLVLSGGLDEGNSGGPVIVGENLAAMVTRKVGAGGFAVPATQMRDVLKTWGVGIDVGVVAGTAFKDCDECPEMVVIPEGSFAMGAPPDEPDRRGDERPQRPVLVSKFALGRTEVTRREFRRFVRETGRTVRGCRVYDGRDWQRKSEPSWENPGFSQTDTHPVVCVSWDDARGYVRWLSQRSGHAYRLASEAEWEYAARAGSQGARYWGDAEAACSYANVADQTAKQVYPGWDVFECNDRSLYTAPVRSFGRNDFGLYDMLGNVSEWVQDCWTATDREALQPGAGGEAGGCSQRVTRGGAWSDGPRGVRFAERWANEVGIRSGYIGFRVVRELR